MEAGSVLPADEIEPMSGVKAPKSDEEGKGLLSTLFKQGRNLFTSPPKGEGAATLAQGVGETDLSEATREFLAQAGTRAIEWTIQTGLKGVDDFDESKGPTFGDQLVQVYKESFLARLALEKEFDAAEEHIQQLDFALQTRDMELAEARSQIEELRRELQQAVADKTAAENAATLAIRGKLAAENAMRMAGADDEARHDRGDEGLGRSSTLLRHTLLVDGRTCQQADILDALKEAPIRAGANTSLDRELMETFASIASMTRGELSWGSEARLSAKGMTTDQMTAYVVHVNQAAEELKKQGEISTTKMQDFAHFFKLTNSILTSPKAPCARPALLQASRDAEDRGGDVPVFCSTYAKAANRSKEGLPDKEIKEAVQAMEDDGKILGKIIEVLAVSISPSLKEQIESGDKLSFGTKDITSQWAKSCANLGYAKRHLVGKDMMKAVQELFGIFDTRKEVLTDKSNKRLKMFRDSIKLALERWEQKHQTAINTAVLIEIFMAEAYCKNAKPCPVIAAFFSTMKTLGKYQEALQDWGEYKKVYKQFADDIERYDSENWDSKKAKPKDQEKVKEKDLKIVAGPFPGAGRGGGGNGTFSGGKPGFGRGDSRMKDRVPQAFVNRVPPDLLGRLQELEDMVMFAAKKEHNPCPKCHLEHPLGQCTKSDNQKVRNDHIAPLLHRLVETDDKKQRLRLGRDMVAAATKGAQNAYKPKSPRPKPGPAAGAAGGGTVVAREKASPELLQKCWDDKLCIEFAMTGKCTKKTCPFTHKRLEGKTEGKKVAFKGTGVSMMNFFD